MPLFGQDLGEWVIGQTHPILQLTWRDDDDVIIPLTGAALSGKIAPRNAAPGSGTALANAPVMISAIAGRFNYPLAPAEVAVAGQYQIQFVATFPTADPLYHRPLLITFIRSI